MAAAEADMIAGKVDQIVVWRLDRLGRTAAGLTALFEDLPPRLGFEALRDKVDLSTAAGRLMANVLASVAAYENEVRSERIVPARPLRSANGKRWGGSPKGRRSKVTTEQVQAIHRLKDEGGKVAAIARATGLWRPTIYSVLGTAEFTGRQRSFRESLLPPLYFRIFSCSVHAFCVLITTRI